MASLNATSAFSDASLPMILPLKLPLSLDDLACINTHLKTLTPQEIILWGISNLPDLAQTTAFGLTGLVAIDMISKLNIQPSRKPPLIFLDTLYHFSETYELVEDVKRHYNVPVHVYRPYGCDTVHEFEKMFGKKFWEVDENSYDYVVEPAQRAYETLSVKSVITGRRSSQGASRSALPPLEIDSTGLLKLNPLFSWTFKEVEAYIKDNDVPRNKLLAEGYRSVGDWHSTNKVEEGQDERAGRWAGKQKTECGLHEDYFKMKSQAKVAV